MSKEGARRCRAVRGYMAEGAFSRSVGVVLRFPARRFTAPRMPIRRKNTRRT